MLFRSFSLAGDTIPNAGFPGRANCQDQTIFAIVQQFGGTEPEAALLLGFFSVDALQEGVSVFCQTPM